MSESAVRQKTTVGVQDMQVGVEVEPLARGGDETDGSRDDVITVEVDLEVQSKGTPGASGQLAEQFSVVAEEDSQSLRQGENHLTVGDIFEQLLPGPMSPQELSFFMATGAQTPCFAGESNYEFVPAAPATSSGKT